MTPGTTLAIGLAAALLPLASAAAADDPLPSWNEGRAKQAIVTFVEETTDPAGPRFVPPEERVATFDQDGTLWVEQPLYAQVMYALDRVPALVAARPELADEEPVATVLAEGPSALATLTRAELETLLSATLSGMSVETFTAEATAWLATARDPRWGRPYTELTYAPMQELLRYLRANGYSTWIVTGGGQDFVRAYSEPVYGIPVEQVVGSAGGTRYGHDACGRPTLTKEPTLLLDNNEAGKPEGIHLMIGRRPRLAFGNSTGDEQMLEYTDAGEGARLALLLLHDDATREYAYGPAQGLPATRVGAFPEALRDKATARGWVVVSMKNDWNRIFSWQSK